MELLASALDLNDLHIVLQSTSLRQVQERLGGSVSQQGDAGVAVRSLCYYQPHSANPWVLWLESSELYRGDVIHGFRLARLAAGAQPDASCIPMRARSDPVLAGVRLGEPQEQLIATLGPPANETPGTLLFLRARLIEIEETLFTVSSRVFIRLRAGQVESIEASKSTSIA